MKLRFLLAAGLAAISIPATSWAAEVPVPVAGCSSSRDLLTIDDTLAKVDFRIYDEDQTLEIIALVESLDENGDHHLCSKQYKPNRGQDKKLGVEDYVVTQIGDNRIGLP